MKIRVFEAFSGVGAQAMALKALQRDFPGKVDFEFVGTSEIDKYAVILYQAVHGDTPNFGDISKIDWNEVPDFDLFTYSFPCQSVSVAGLQKGLTEGSGTTSSLLWECKRAIEAKRPKYLLMENVAALVSKKFMPDFQRWLDWLARQGYTTYWDVLNAKDYNIPQNRERVFAVSFLEPRGYDFPPAQQLTKCLKDVLEQEVDESYYLKSEAVDRILAQMKENNANLR